MDDLKGEVHDTKTLRYGQKARLGMHGLFTWSWSWSSAVNTHPKTTLKYFKVYQSKAHGKPTSL